MFKPPYNSFIFLLFLLLYSLIGSRYIDAGNDYQSKILENESPTSMFWLFLIGSFVETLIFNLLLNYIFRKQKLIYIKNYLIIIICSITFGFAHFSTFKFLIITFIAGIVFNLNFYIYLKYYKNYIIATFSTFLLHFFSNFFTYTIAYLINK